MKDWACYKARLNADEAEADPQGVVQTGTSILVTILYDSLRKQLWALMGPIGFLLLPVGCSFYLAPTPTSISEPTYKIVLANLGEPRGLWLRNDGSLCVAEAGGVPEDQKLDTARATVYANTGALTCVDSRGRRERVAKNLPYVLYRAQGSSIGPADVAELDGSFYLLTGEGYQDLSRKLLRLTPEGSPQVVADFLEFGSDGKSPAYAYLADIEPGGIASNPFAMIPDAANHRLLVTDAASGRVLAAELNGRIEVYAPVDGHEVLTGISWGPDGLVYVASFSQLPHPAGTGAIVRIQPDGTSTTVLGNLTTPIDLAFDRAGYLYVLEFVYATPAADPYRAKTGRLLRFAPQGERWTSEQVLVEGLPYPSALLIGPDDSLYISINGAFSFTRNGAVLRFDNLTAQNWQRPPLQYHP